MKYFYLILICVVPFIGQSQNVNSHNPTIPFGSNVEYEFGMMPTNFPSGGEFGKSQDAYDMYVEWHNDWVHVCRDSALSVGPGMGYEHYSEGVGLGMIISAYMTDKNTFDSLYRYYLQRKNWDTGLLGWRSSCYDTDGNESGSASHADLEAAMALLVAEKQWP